MPEVLKHVLKAVELQEGRGQSLTANTWGEARAWEAASHHNKDIHITEEIFCYVLLFLEGYVGSPDRPDNEADEIFLH